MAPRFIVKRRRRVKLRFEIPNISSNVLDLFRCVQLINIDTVQKLTRLVRINLEYELRQIRIFRMDYTGRSDKEQDKFNFGNTRTKDG